MLAIKEGQVARQDQRQLVAGHLEADAWQDAGHGCRHRIGHPEQRADQPGACREFGRSQPGQRRRRLALEPIVAHCNDLGEKGPAWMIDPDQRAIGDGIDALRPAIVGMRPPADIGQQARDDPQPSLLHRFHGARNFEELPGKLHEVTGMGRRPRPED
jgi:hypothetical protein